MCLRTYLPRDLLCNVWNHERNLKKKLLSTFYLLISIQSQKKVLFLDSLFDRKQCSLATRINKENLQQKNTRVFLCKIFFPKIDNIYSNLNRYSSSCSSEEHDKSCEQSWYWYWYWFCTEVVHAPTAIISFVLGSSSSFGLQVS